MDVAAATDMITDPGRALVTATDEATVATGSIDRIEPSALTRAAHS